MPVMSMDDIGARNDLFDAMLRHGEDRWRDALLAARILSIGGSDIGGLWLTARAGGVRELYLDHLRATVNRPFHRLAPGATAASLSGRLDLGETAKTRHVVWEPGILTAVNGGVLVIPMAERLDRGAAAIIAETMDRGYPPSLRPGAERRRTETQTRFCVVALDEAIDGEEQIAPALGERLGLHVNLDGIALQTAAGETISENRTVCGDWRAVLIDERMLGQLLTIASAGGHASLGVLQRLAKVARIIALVAGRSAAGEADVLDALRICLGIRLVHGEPESQPQTNSQEQDDRAPEASGTEPNPSTDLTDADCEHLAGSPDRLEELLAAVEHGTIDGLSLAVSERAARKAGHAGKAGRDATNARRGRPYSSSLSAPFPEARPDIVATLRQAAPWQLIRTRMARKDVVSEVEEDNGARSNRLLIRKEDFRYQRLRHPCPSTAIFVVDASGSTALERLGETKGAIEELLARCYVRRDEVSLIAFRGRQADLLMPPTRSLVAAKRKLSGLPGGGPTPLASGLKKGLELALSVRRRGHTPVVVVMTDGSGNIALDGSPDRALAARESEQIAGLYRAHRLTSICIDIARRPRDGVTQLAGQLGAPLHVLRRADRSQMSDLVHASMEAART